MVIKYIGSKRTLIPQLSELAATFAPSTAVDLFTGTTRVAQAFKKQGILTTAADLARYSHIFAQTYIATDSKSIDIPELQKVLDELNSLPGVDGFFTENFCRKARFIQEHNGKRIDAIREAIERDHAGSPHYPIILTSLIEAADKVDSTTGVQMAYLKQWAARSHNNLKLTMPELLPGAGRAVLGDATDVIRDLDHTDLLYLDPPYNQHRYDGNYHLWSSLVIWDKMEGYGIANKRLDLLEEDGKSVFNKKREIGPALDGIIQAAKADTIMVSFNNEGWLSAADIEGMLAKRGQQVLRLDFDFKRYVGAQIGIHNPKGEKVGTVKSTRNVEHVFITSTNTAALESVEAAYSQQG